MLALDLSQYRVLNLVPGGFLYEERWDLFKATVSGAWETVVVPGAPANRLIHVVIDKRSGNNDTIGIRSVGSALIRLVRVDKNSPASFFVKTNGSSEVQVYTDNVAQTDFYAEAYF